MSYDSPIPQGGRIAKAVTVHREVCMRRILAEMTLAALMAACSEQATAPLKKIPAVAPDFTKNVDGSADVEHAVLCSNLSGSVFVRQQCHENEQQLDPVAFGLVGLQGPAGP